MKNSMLIRKEWRLLLMDRPIEAMQNMKHRTGYPIPTIRYLMLEPYAHVLARYVRRFRRSKRRFEAAHFLGQLAQVLRQIDRQSFTDSILEFLHTQAA